MGRGITGGSRYYSTYESATSTYSYMLVLPMYSAVKHDRMSVGWAVLGLHESMLDSHQLISLSFLFSRVCRNQRVVLLLDPVGAASTDHRRWVSCNLQFGKKEDIYAFACMLLPPVPEPTMMDIARYKLFGR